MTAAQTSKAKPDLSPIQAEIKRLGGKRWQRLHRLIYLTGICGVVHFWMIVKSDVYYPALFGIEAATMNLSATRAVSHRVKGWDRGAPRRSHANRETDDVADGDRVPLERDARLDGDLRLLSDRRRCYRGDGEEQRQRWNMDSRLRGNAERRSRG